MPSIIGALSGAGAIFGFFRDLLKAAVEFFRRKRYHAEGHEDAMQEVQNEQLVDTNKSLASKQKLDDHLSREPSSLRDDDGGQFTDPSLGPSEGKSGSV